MQRMLHLVEEWCQIKRHTSEEKPTLKTRSLFLFLFLTINDDNFKVIELLLWNIRNKI